MRASIDIYVHPELSSSDIWPKDGAAARRMRVTLYSILGAFCVVTAVSTYAAYQYTTLGKSLHDRFVSLPAIVLGFMISVADIYLLSSPASSSNHGCSDTHIVPTLSSLSSQFIVLATRISIISSVLGGTGWRVTEQPSSLARNWLRPRNNSIYVRNSFSLSSLHDVLVSFTIFL